LIDHIGIHFLAHCSKNHQW